MIIIKIALTLTEYETLLKDIVAQGKTYPGYKGDIVERWIAEEVGLLVDKAKAAPTKYREDNEIMG